ncbi:hypothetical protein TNCV_1617671 [Trichonephila clavipes]|nr:hypothetical protein TNCV_1617671 [Trichonephila clavipes]
MCVCVQNQLWQTKKLWSLFKAQKNIDADSDDENELSNAASVLPSSEMRNVMKRMRSYLDAHSNGEMNNNMEVTISRETSEPHSGYQTLTKILSPRKPSDYEHRLNVLPLTWCGISEKEYVR